MEHLHFGGIRLGILSQHPRVALTELVVQPGLVAPAHRHAAADEVFYGLSPGLEVQVDGAWHGLAPHAVVAAPAGSSHGFRNTGQVPARALVVFTPGRFVDFFREAHSVAETTQLKAVMARWGVSSG